MNGCLEETDVPEWKSKRKTTLIQERSPKGNVRQQLETHNVSTHDVENTNGSNNGDLQFAKKSRTVP